LVKIPHCKQYDGVFLCVRTVLGEISVTFLPLTKGNAAGAEPINQRKRNKMNVSEKAKEAVSTASGIPVGKLYTVWSVKVLRNWKALVSTDAVSGHYWEVTYNGDPEKDETYVDTYIKHQNITIR
jgi:hypothetical protein